jgi:hypothetical protein
MWAEQKGGDKMAIRRWEDRFPPQRSSMVVWAMNALPAIFFAKTMVVTKGGQVGMFAGIVLLWGIGAGLIAIFSKMRFALPVGGFVIGLFQLLPLVQAIIALVPLEIVSRLTMRLDSNALTEAGGFFCTIIVGGTLMVLSTGAGLLIDALAFADNVDRET